jgi:hypothetical protein
VTPRHRPKAAPRRPASPAPPPGLPAGVAIVPLALLLALRLALLVVPGTWLWGLDIFRDLSPSVSWALLALAAATLVPPIGDALARAASPLARPSGASAVWTTAAAALLAAGVVLLLPDRAWFLGDFQMRQGAIEGGLFESFLPMSLPLDAFLHDHLPVALRARVGLEPALYARALGALEAALLAGLSLAFARRASAAAGEGATATPWLALAVGAGVPLALCTGFPKSTADLCVLTLALAVLGLRLLRGDRVHLAFGLVLAATLLDHRSALVFLPAAVYALVARLRARDAAGPLALAALPPLAALVAMAPRIARIVREYDVPMHLRTGAAARASLGTALAGPGIRVLDVLNALLIVAPALVLLPVLLRGGRRLLAGPGGRYLLVLAAAFLPIVLVVQPRQGLFRDWEVLTPAGVALTLVVAWAVGSAIASRRTSPRLAVALAGATLAPALALVLHANAPERGLARARALLAGPPVRTLVERTFLWDYVGERSAALGRWPEAAQAFERVAEVEPERGVLLSWALAAVDGGDFGAARRAFALMLAQQPDDAAARAGLGGAAAQLGDRAAADSAGARLALDLQDAGARAAVRQLLHDHPRLWPALADSLGR